MLDVAIIGAGLCGLALARQLARQGRTVRVFEARERVGGRVLTTRCPVTDAPLDLGPTWIWPDTEPRITALLDELGLATLPQHDEGRTLVLSDPNRPPEAHRQDFVHGDARRLRDGVGALIDRLLRDLPEGTVSTGLALHRLSCRKGHVELQFRPADAQAPVPLPLQARHVVLALPPRLAHEHLHFDPALPEDVQESLRDARTWMAAQAKSLVTFASPFWRAAGLSGNAFVAHPQATLAEVFDASPDAAAAAGPGVLGGFSALPPSYRASVGGSLALLVDSQWAQLFGLQAQATALHRVNHDWATEPWTCSTADRQAADAPPDRDAGFLVAGWGDPLLRRPVWEGRLHFAGTETATAGAGHMEGALDAAARVARALVPGLRTTATASASAIDPDAGAVHSAFQPYADWVRRERHELLARYRGHLHRLLSAQHAEALTQQALLATAEQIYSLALGELHALPLPAVAAPAQGGRHELTPTALAPFSGFSKSLVETALDFNRSSCALSNFPDEAQPAPESLAVITRDLAAAWHEFALAVNAHLLARAPALDATA